MSRARRHGRCAARHGAARTTDAALRVVELVHQVAVGRVEGGDQVHAAELLGGSVHQVAAATGEQVEAVRRYRDQAVMHVTESVIALAVTISVSRYGTHANFGCELWVVNVSRSLATL